MTLIQNIVDRLTSQGTTPTYNLVTSVAQAPVVYTIQNPYTPPPGPVSVRDPIRNGLDYIHQVISPPPPVLYVPPEPVPPIAANTNIIEISRPVTPAPTIIPFLDPSLAVDRDRINSPTITTPSILLVENQKSMLPLILAGLAAFLILK